MADRKNTHILDNSGLYTSGDITHCNFSSNGSKLAIADADGNICFYQNNSKKQPVYLRQFNTLNHHNLDSKQFSNIHTVKELGNNDFQKFITADDLSIKLWAYDPSDFFLESNFQINNLSIPHFCPNILKPTLKGQLNQSCTSLDLDNTNNNILFQNGQLITLINLETGIPIYNYAPAPSFRPPVSLRSPKQPKLDHFERTQAESDFWNEIPTVTKARFQKHQNNKFLYSNKLGQIQCVDLRLSQNDSSVLLLGTPRGKTTAQCCLNVVSDFALTQTDNEIISRDFLYKWDMKYPKTWIWRQSVYPQTNSQICELYQQGKIYNQFSVGCDSQGHKIFTTHFEQSFHQINITQQTNHRYKQTEKGNQVEKVGPLTIDNIRNSAKLYETESLKSFDYDPNTNIVCTAINNTIRLYCPN